MTEMQALLNTPPFVKSMGLRCRRAWPSVYAQCYGVSLEEPTNSEASKGLVLRETRPEGKDTPIINYGHLRPPVQDRSLNNRRETHHGSLQAV